VQHVLPLGPLESSMFCISLSIIVLLLGLHRVVVGVNMKLKELGEKFSVELKFKRQKVALDMDVKVVEPPLLIS
jgi:hypothetical protein